MKLTPREARLATAMSEAKRAALAVQPGGDGGSANLDSVFLYARRGLRDEAVRRAAEVAGVSVGSRWRTTWWNGWFLYYGHGQGAMRTRMAEAAASALSKAGESVTVYYKVD